MGETLAGRLRNAIEKQGALRAGERVAVAVSGGADSVALLLLLLELRKPLGIVLSVVHFNHRIRGKASDADEKFVANLARKHGLAVHIGRSDVATKAKQDKTNLEDTARRARYEFFAELAEKEHLNKVAVAHTADDQAETVLAHILRGTGLAGLGGIHPVAGRVVRPLLGLRRAELRAYLRSRKQTWREDATNRDITRMRARIRKKLLPILEKQFQPGIVEHLTTLAELAREDEAFLDALVAERAKRCVERTTGSATIRVLDLLCFGEKGEFITENSESTGRTEGADKNLAIRRRMVRWIVKEVKPRAGQVRAEHVRAVLELAQRGENGKRLPLPGGLEVRREHDRLIFRAGRGVARAKGGEERNFERVVNLDGKATAIRIEELGCVFRFRVIDWPVDRGQTIETGSVLDLDVLRSPLMLRNWRAGDRLQPAGHRGAHKLKRLLSKKSVSGMEREGWPVLTSGGAIAWARGFPVAAEFGVRSGTRAGVVIAEEAIS